MYNQKYKRRPRIYTHSQSLNCREQIPYVIVESMTKNKNGDKEYIYIIKIVPRSLLIFTKLLMP